MKKIFHLLVLLACGLVVTAQKFPALSENHKKQLLATGIKIPLPAWLPEGFSLDTIIISNIGEKDNGEDRALFIQYSKQLKNGTWQSFYVDAGFDGLGSLWYKGEPVQSPVGKMIMYYQPMEETEPGEKPVQATALIGTEWFTVHGHEFHVFCIVTDEIDRSEDEMEEEHEDEVDKRIFVPIPKNEFKKILQSLQILK